MSEQTALAQRIADTIRPAMLSGLQDAQLHGPGGAQHISNWADWIAATVAEHVVQPIAAERDAFADRVDTLSHIAKRHKEGYADAVRDKQQLEARIEALEAELAQLRTAEDAHQS
ncbi:hypothetical protein ACFC1R_13165 [Kitasatospora sp. NPDC056138]|uniref:hypothetical protein n=1 Tax=Kitasatospora sp. NPDC056138 TaxID=3345724 RepID=UPI0035E22858